MPLARLVASEGHSFIPAQHTSTISKTSEDDDDRDRSRSRHNRERTIASVVARVRVVERHRYTAARHGRRAGSDLDRVQRAVRGQVHHVPQPVEPVGAERLDRHHGHRHGVHHRHPQHRPVGRLAARLPRLHDGAGADRRPHLGARLEPHHRQPQGQPVVHVDHRACGGPDTRSARRAAPGFPRGVRGRTRLHRHTRRLSGVARPDLPHRRQARPDPRPARRDVPLPRWCPGAVARRLEDLDRRRTRVRGHRVQHRHGPSPAAAPRPRRAIALHGRRVRDRRLRGRRRRDLAGRRQVRITHHW